jgi:hypothetical protein
MRVLSRFAPTFAVPYLTVIDEAIASITRQGASISSSS